MLNIGASNVQIMEIILDLQSILPFSLFALLFFIIGVVKWNESCF